MFPIESQLPPQHQFSQVPQKPPLAQEASCLPRSPALTSCGVMSLGPYTTPAAAQVALCRPGFCKSCCGENEVNWRDSILPFHKWRN